MSSYAVQNVALAFLAFAAYALMTAPHAAAAALETALRPCGPRPRLLAARAAPLGQSVPVGGAPAGGARPDARARRGEAAAAAA